ncbi:MAG: xylan 1,4-beta-xylosidase [Lachnospiraceae bacterium]|nr:xylan 1,4-beta-xylosidase [Lachnospiraceae bacterium]
MSNESRFEIAHYEAGNGIKVILIDKKTGVNYLLVQIGEAGGLTPLLGTDGKPVITR